ncbi:hypothetical protein [Colwellia sp. MEBiC06753]
MAAKKSFPLRINPDILAATQRWADDELRSVNAQIEYLLREALVKSGRVKLVQQVVTVVEPTEQETKGSVQSNDLQGNNSSEDNA